MQYFYINQGSTLNSLRMELINDGRFEFIKSGKYADAIQNADVYFSMWDSNDKIRISNAPCTIIESSDEGCETRYIIEYRWNKRDTKEKGTFRGRFTISFKDGLKVEGDNNPLSGDLIMPIYEDLHIMVK